MPGPETASRFLSEEDWGELLREIRHHQVIPIVGPDLVTVPGPTGVSAPLHQVLAQPFAAALGVPQPPALSSLNAVASAYLLAGGKPKRLYSELATLLDGLDSPLPPALRELAAISDFDFFIAATIDSLLACAMEEARPGFHRAEHVRAYDCKRPVDLPEHFGPGHIYHLLGNRETYPNFAIWEEDHLEFIFSLARHEPQLKRLYLYLRSRFLLILGAPFHDWIVRCFLYLAKGGRFTERRRDDTQACIAGDPKDLGEPLIFFFDQVVGTTRIICGDPCEFAGELGRRWRLLYGAQAEDDDPLLLMPETMARGSVFISYSRDDLDAVRALVRELRAAQIPVWVDKQRLEVGEDYERSLEMAVKNHCSFFLSLISTATESDATRYVHRERAWAAQRHVDGFVFYLPAVIDPAPRQPRLEPPSLARLHFEHFPGGRPTPAFVRRLQRLVGEWRVSGQPRA